MNIQQLCHNLRQLIDQRRYRKLRQLILDCHVHSMDMFPHEGLLAFGGSINFARRNFMSLITRKLMEMLPLLKRASLPEESRAVAVAIVDSNITLIRHMEDDGKTGNADAANHRARLFYLLIGVLWQTLKPHLDQASLPPAHGTLSPFEGMLKNSGFSELWTDTDVKQSIGDLMRLARAKDTTRTASSLR